MEEEERGRQRWGGVYEERERDGHELFMNVSMKGSKKEEGRGSEEMAAATDLTDLWGTLLPKSAVSPPALPLQFCLLFSHASFTLMQKNAAKLLVPAHKSWHERFQLPQVKTRSAHTFYQGETELG